MTRRLTYGIIVKWFRAYAISRLPLGVFAIGGSDAGISYHRKCHLPGISQLGVQVNIKSISLNGAIAFAIVSAASQAHAAVLYDTGPTTGNYSSNNMAGGGLESSFTLSQASVVTGV